MIEGWTSFSHNWVCLFVESIALRLVVVKHKIGDPLIRLRSQEARFGTND